MPIQAVGMPQYSGASVFMELTLYMKKTIPFTVIVDDEDYEKVKSFKWFVRKQKRNFYCQTGIPNPKGGQMSITMHQIILGKIPRMCIDHINSNGLDNRKSNLRQCTFKENTRNQRVAIDNRTGFRGVRLRIDTGKYEARIRVDGVLINLGQYKNPKEAAIKYNEAALNYFGEFAWLNKM